MKELTEQQQEEKEINDLCMKYKEEQRLHKLIRTCKSCEDFSNLDFSSFRGTLL